jgi:hypothetical protein
VTFRDRIAVSCRVVHAVSASTLFRGMFAPTPKLLQEDPIAGASPWLLTFMKEWRSLRRKPIWSIEQRGFRANLHYEGASLWLFVTWPSGARVAFCLAYCPAGGRLKESESADSKFTCRIDAGMGVYEVKIELPSAQPLFHWQTTLTPAEDMIVPFWPCDIYPIDNDCNPLETRGAVHTEQRGPRGACIYATLTRPAPGTFLYMQNLTALNPYFEKTRTSAADRISGRWPELGFSLPPSPEHALRERQPMVISDAFVLCSPEAPRNDLESARLHLDLYADLYLAFPKPAPVHRDWPRRVEETISDVAHSPACSVVRNGHRYLLAYVGADDRPPESMVQLAVLVPLMEYAQAYGEKIPCLKELQASIPTFYNPKIKSVVRWLPGEEHLLKGGEDHMGEHVMDSWYLYHTFLNLARLAQHGDTTVEKLFLESLKYGIKVAQHFEYRWPVLYDIYTLKAIRAERSPGRGGEQDVGAQYVHILQQAFKLTGDRGYIEEAERAARRLVGLGFELGYQYNNTSFGAGGLLWLWRETGCELYRELSHVCMANIVQNFWLWQSSYGYAKHYSIFMGLPPLRNAPYLALYEELELLAAFHEYLELAGDDAPRALRVLLPEYCKYLIDRAWYHYPSELPKDAIADQARSGHLDRNLSIPLEDIYDGWRKAGEVGQQVYGAAAPFVFATRHCHQIRGDDVIVHCDYPVRDFKVRGPVGHRRITFAAQGDRRCECHVRIVPRNFTPLPNVDLRSNGRKREGLLTEFGYIEFALPGNAEVIVKFHVAKGGRNGPMRPECGSPRGKRRHTKASR